MSTITTPTEEKRSAPPEEAFWPSFLRFWSSLKLGIVLMLAIAAGAIIGTVVPQGDASVILNLDSSDSFKRFLLAIGANNVYYSGWFLSLLGLFFLNLLCSTLTVVVPRLKVALRKPPEVSVAVQERHHENKVLLPEQPIETVAQAFKASGYRVYAARNGGLVAHKGRWSRFAPLMTHLGLFAILLGAIWSGLTVFKASVPLFPGEQVEADYMVAKLAQPRGALVMPGRDWSVRLDKFWMEYYDNQTVRQFYSTISIFKDDKVVETKTIYVNSPFVYDGVWFYQAFWGVGGAELKIGGKEQRVDLENAQPMGLQGSLSKLVPVGGSNYILYLKNERSPLMILHFTGAGQPQPVASLEKGQSTRLGGVEVQYLQPALYSGLQTKQDPGIPFVYTGFIILMLGTSLAFFNLRQVWVGPREGGYLVSGKANRGHVAFQRELARIAIKLGAKANA